MINFSQLCLITGHTNIRDVKKPWKMVVISCRNQNSNRMSYALKSLQTKKQLSTKFHVNSGFLLLRHNSDKIKYLTPQNMGLEETRL